MKNIDELRIDVLLPHKRGKKKTTFTLYGPSDAVNTAMTIIHSLKQDDASPHIPKVSGITVWRSGNLSVKATRWLGKKIQIQSSPNPPEN